MNKLMDTKKSAVNKRKNEINKINRINKGKKSEQTKKRVGMNILFFRHYAEVNRTFYPMLPPYISFQYSCPPSQML